VSIGVDVVSSFGYGRRLRPLNAAAVDARLVEQYTASCGLPTQLLVNGAATTTNVREAIAAAARQLSAGDRFLLAFNGHGLAGEGPSGFQQSWCLYDQPLVRFGDDGLDAQLALFRAGVRVLVVANCCHSGVEHGPTLPTPRIRAHVVRFAACNAADIALDWSDATRPSPFAKSFVDAVRRGCDGGIVGLFARIARTCGGLPQLEIGEPRSEAFLADGF
jgi:hypothetical protein